MVAVAEIEIRHSRSVAPTRRVALGDLWLPTATPPGAGGLLLAGVVAVKSQSLDAEERDDLDVLISLLETGRTFSQPRLRHRFQTDVVGLDRSRHRLLSVGQALALELDDHAHDLPQVLGAVYAASQLPPRARAPVFRLVWRALRWEGGNDASLIAYLSGDSVGLLRRHKTAAWALAVLGFEPHHAPAPPEVLGRFRTMVRRVHPDHGGAIDDAGQRVSDLTEAKRILLAAP
ncbi:MAG: hypothetical protein H0W70_09245 [Actinobacteria bacterium]|nr:hypothetical protein [Actinomycetota bacterium]